MECILDNIHETTKTDIASAGVLLGLLPALLGVLGSSTIETSCLATRRPVLAFLLCFASPAVNPIRMYDYTDVLEKIMTLNETVRLPGMSGNGSQSVALAKYVFALAAIANIQSMN